MSVLPEMVGKMMPQVAAVTDSVEQGYATLKNGASAVSNFVSGDKAPEVAEPSLWERAKAKLVTAKNAVKNGLKKALEAAPSTLLFTGALFGANAAASAYTGVNLLGITAQSSAPEIINGLAFSLGIGSVLNMGIGGYQYVSGNGQAAPLPAGTNAAAQQTGMAQQPELEPQVASPQNLPPIPARDGVRR